jgi:hypothetical protein
MASSVRRLQFTANPSTASKLGIPNYFFYSDEVSDITGPTMPLAATGVISGLGSVASETVSARLESQQTELNRLNDSLILERDACRQQIALLEERLRDLSVQKDEILKRLQASQTDLQRARLLLTASLGGPETTETLLASELSAISVQQTTAQGSLRLQTAREQQIESLLRRNQQLQNDQTGLLTRLKMVEGAMPFSSEPLQVFL